MFVLVDVHGHKFVANFWGVLGCIDQAELLGVHLLQDLRLLVEVDALRFDFLVPSDLIQTLAEEDHIGQHNLIEFFVHSLTGPEQVKREDLIHQHLRPVLLRQVEIVSFPFGVALDHRC